MLDVQDKGDRVMIDVRKRILNGEHPRGEIIKFVRHAPKGTIVEIHVPHPAPPLVAGLESLGHHVIINELAPDHYRLMIVKIS